MLCLVCFFSSQIENSPNTLKCCSVFQVCSSFKFEYLAFHFWVGMWLAVIVTVFVAFEGSVLVRYVSRFTQDIFALLISLIFIFESFKKIYMVSVFCFGKSR